MCDACGADHPELDHVRAGELVPGDVFAFMNTNQLGIVTSAEPAGEHQELVSLSYIFTAPVFANGMGKCDEVTKEVDSLQRVGRLHKIGDLR